MRFSTTDGRSQSMQSGSKPWTRLRSTFGEFSDKQKLFRPYGTFVPQPPYRGAVRLQRTGLWDLYPRLPRQLATTIESWLAYGVRYCSAARLYSVEITLLIFVNFFKAAPPPVVCLCFTARTFLPADNLPDCRTMPRRKYISG